MAERLWKCPECGHRFVTRNLWHSCGRYRIADHFRGKDPVVQRMFRKFVRLVRSCGPATVYAQKTRIVCMTRVRFAGAVARKRTLRCGLWLTRKVDHPKLQHTETFGPHSYGHHFVFADPADLDSAFAKLVREAYAVRAHVSRGD